MISLERVDPNIMRQIKEQTLQEIVHTKREPGITKEEKNPDKSPLSILKLKKKIKRYNGVLKKHHINIFLDVEEGEELFLRVLERESGELIQIYNDEEVEELLMKLENFIGFFIDNRI
jgi:uncharacterized FlaG/YvyC family protein